MATFGFILSYPRALTEMSGLEPKLPVTRLVRSLLALHHNKKHHTDNGKHSECRFLPIPLLRLPHQKPLAPDIEECHQPHQQARRQRNHREVLRCGELLPVRTIRFQQTNTTPPT